MVIKIYVNAQIVHLSQIFTGLTILEKHKLVSLSFVKDREVTHDQPILRMEVDGKMVVFDLADSSELLYRHIFENSDFYFKRMLTTNILESSNKIFPYGLNYPVFHENDHVLHRSIISGDLKFFLKNYVRISALFSSIVNNNLAYKHCLVEHFEGYPKMNSDPKIIYFTRLWNPDNVKNSFKKEARLEMNALRIELVRQLRIRFGDKFMGGILKDSFSAKRAADVLADDNKYLHKKIYLQNLRTCSIGIADPGLEDSVGFKFAEYVAMSKAIVSTPINTVLPGDFKAGSNYLQYTDIRGCLDICDHLLTSKNDINNLEENNFTYYHRYLRPDLLVYNCLSQIQ